MYYSPHIIRKLDWGMLDGWGIKHAWKIWKMHTHCNAENMKRRDHLQDTGVEGKIIWDKLKRQRCKDED